LRYKNFGSCLKLIRSRKTRFCSCEWWFS